MKYFKTLLLFYLAFSAGLFSKSNQSSKYAYLGVYTSVLGEDVSYQLGLPANLHLSVEQVVSDSPADKAGIKKFDILIKLNDQILVNPKQLKYLVRSMKPSDKINLNLLRKGKEKNIEIILGSTNTTFDLNPREQKIDHPFGLDYLKNDPSFRNPEFRKFFERYSDIPFLRNRKFFNSPNSVTNDDDPLHASSDIKSFTYKSNESQMMFSDEKGSLELIEKDGKKSLRATDPNGKVLFDGPINTENERKSIPSFIAERLKKMEKNMSVN